MLETILSLAIFVNATTTPVFVDCVKTASSTNCGVVSAATTTPTNVNITVPLSVVVKEKIVYRCEPPKWTHPTTTRPRFEKPTTTSSVLTPSTDWQERLLNRLDETEKRFEERQENLLKQWMERLKEIQDRFKEQMDNIREQIKRKN